MEAKASKSQTGSKLAAWQESVCKLNPRGSLGCDLEPSIPHCLMLQNKTNPNREEGFLECTDIIF